MYTVTKEFKWEMAHMLEDHPGLCKNLHGHSYRAEVTFARADGRINKAKHQASTGMVVDFSVAKEILNRNIFDQWDHAVMINTDSKDPFEKALEDLCMGYEKKVYLVCGRATAEYMAQMIFDIGNSHLPIHINIVKVRVYETATSYAEYEIK